MMKSDIAFPILEPWEQSFFAGDRLKAEIRLLAAGFLGLQRSSQVAAGSSLLHRSHGGVVSGEYKNAFVQYQEAQPELAIWPNLEPISSLLKFLMLCCLGSLSSPSFDQ